MLVRFDPFREVDRVADQAFGPLRSPRPSMPVDALRPSLPIDVLRPSLPIDVHRPSLPIDVHRLDNEVVAFLDLPGVSPDTIELTVDKHDVTVTAERSEPRFEGAKTLVRERPNGRFTRRLHLGEGLDLDHVSAEYEHGVLKVSIPLAEQAKPRRVEVRIAPQVSAPVEEEPAA
jgi:HSP20 family protein